MFEELKAIQKRPEPFSVYTAETLWTKPHLAKQMLHYHLNQDTDLASRPLSAVDRIVKNLDEKIKLDRKSVCDLGCGPGLYANKFAEHGAIVHGIDFSENSIIYAQEHSKQTSGSTKFTVGNYLSDLLPGHQDVVTLIYCDLCPLSREQRKVLLSKVKKALKPDGVFIFDVLSEKAFDSVTEGTSFGRNFMNGFWSEDDYFTFQNTFRYEEERVSLDHYTIVEKGGRWDVYNWFKYFTREEIEIELAEAGFRTIEFSEGFGHNQSDETTFGVFAFS